MAQGLKQDAEKPAPPIARGAVLVVACAGGLLLAVSVVPPWLSERDQRGAIERAETSPRRPWSGSTARPS